GSARCGAPNVPAEGVGVLKKRAAEAALNVAVLEGVALAVVEHHLLLVERPLTLLFAQPLGRAMQFHPHADAGERATCPPRLDRAEAKCSPFGKLDEREAVCPVQFLEREADVLAPV